MEPNGSRQEFFVWITSLCLWLCHTLPFSIGLHEMLTCASKSKESFLVFSFSQVTFRPSSASWQPSCKCALVYSSACHSCGLIKPFHPKMSGETISSTSSISRTRSKCCNQQNMSSMQLLLCSTLEYHTLLYQEVVPSLMASLMKWCSYTPLLTLSLSWSCLECWVCILLWPSEIHSKSYCFEIEEHFVSFFSMIGYPTTKLSMIVCQLHYSAHILWSKS
jgi:hypothetical protein